MAVKSEQIKKIQVEDLLKCAMISQEAQCAISKFGFSWCTYRLKERNLYHYRIFFDPMGRFLVYSYSRRPLGKYTV